MTDGEIIVKKKVIYIVYYLRACQFLSAHARRFSTGDNKPISCIGGHDDVRCQIAGVQAVQVRQAARTALENKKRINNS